MTSHISLVDTKEDFAAIVAAVQMDTQYQKPAAFGLAAVRRVRATDEVLDVRFPTVNLGQNYGSHAIFWSVLDGRTVTPSTDADEALQEILDHFAPFVGDGQNHPNIRAVELLQTLFDDWAVWEDEDSKIELGLELVSITDLSEAPASTMDAWLRLHLLSHRLAQPNTINLDGVFGLLTNVAWTNHGPLLPEWVDAARFTHRDLHTYGVDKFPQMLDYVTPSGVRIADASRVRLGAYLAPGTTVMHEGFVNFNAGTCGASMVEGRISAGVVVGGGASIMGTLSGGGKEVISIGKRSLLGANSGLGISLGDDCVVEAGLYLTAGTKILVHVQLAKALELSTGELKIMAPHYIVPARKLSGVNGIVFRRNSVTGAVEAIPNKKGSPALKPALHAN